MSMIERSWMMMAVIVSVWLAVPGEGRAATYSYVDWTAADAAMGTASGTITLPGGSTVTVTFAAINADGTPGNLYGAQFMEGQTNYWMPATPYISGQVENAPPGTDILQLAGGMNQTYRVTLSEAIKDPVMAIVSLGAPGTIITYDFDAPFTIVSQGTGYWGGTATSLMSLPADVLQGEEGHGTIQFIGTFAAFSWTVPKPETWHGFTFAIRTTSALEPPDAGSGGGVDAGADAGSAVDAADATDTPAGGDAATDAGGKTVPDDCDCALGGARSGSGSGFLSLLGVMMFGGLLARRARRRR